MTGLLLSQLKRFASVSGKSGGIEQLSGDPVAGPVRLWRSLSFGAAVRADTWQLLADAVASGKIALNDAVDGLIEGEMQAKNRTVALVLSEFRVGLRGRRMAERLTPYISSAEQMIFKGLDEQEASRVFASAARLLRTRLALRKALTEAIAMPILLFFSLFGLILFFGIEFLPALGEVVDFQLLPLAQKVTVDVTLALADNPLRLAAWLAGVCAALGLLMRVWTGPGRVFADRFPPFSVMRLQAGAGFLFAVIEYGRGGREITTGLLEEMAQTTGRYEASRIRALITPFGRSGNLGEAALDARQGFIDQKLAVMLRMLWQVEGGLEEAGKFLERRLVRIEYSVRKRMAVLNVALLLIITIALLLLMSIMFSVFDTLNQTGVA